ncbi:MAG: MarR family winged helix-turn-helix transcriptional regulator [Actinomycetes bacterium]
MTRLRIALARVGRSLRHTDEGLSPAHQGCLFVVVRRGPLGMAELARIEQHAPATISRIVAHLQRAGLVTRVPDPDDGRAARVQATAEGRATIQRVTRARDSLLAGRLAELPEQDRARLLEALPALEHLAALGRRSPETP